MLIQMQPPAPKGSPASPRGALWRLGFRPFYLLAAVFAALAVPLWVVLYSGAARPPIGLDPLLWHMHEMVYGFALAVVTGFLFTAVRNWTNLPTPTGARLAALAALWLAARAAWLLALPAVAIVIEVVFLVLVAAALLTVLVRARNRRNYFVAVLFGVLALADMAFFAALRGVITAFGPDLPLRLALYLIVTLTLVMGGRVIPSFTASAVRGVKQFRDVRLDRIALAAAVLAFALELAGAPALPLAVVALAAGVLTAVRVAGWNPRATYGRPLLWILHAGYAWIAVGFLLMAASAAGLVARPLAMHAFGLGGVGGLIIGMITRTALGHTGRPLAVGAAERAMYLLVQGAALVRVLGPIVLPAFSMVWVQASATLWCVAFITYAVVYWPRLSAPRVDGQPG